METETFELDVLKKFSPYKEALISYFKKISTLNGYLKVLKDETIYFRPNNSQQIYSREESKCLSDLTTIDPSFYLVKALVRNINDFLLKNRKGPQSYLTQLSYDNKEGCLVAKINNFKIVTIESELSIDITNVVVNSLYSCGVSKSEIPNYMDYVFNINRIIIYNKTYITTVGTSLALKHGITSHIQNLNRCNSSIDSFVRSRILNKFKTDSNFKGILTSTAVIDSTKLVVGKPSVINLYVPIKKTNTSEVKLNF